VGFNTTIVIYNDALEQIAEDPLFGKRIRDAVLKAVYPKDCPIRLGALCSDAGVVIETHHADQDVLVSVGQNTGTVVTDDRYGKHGQKSLVSIAEIARRLGVTRERATRIAKGQLRARKLAGRYIVLRHEFDHYLSNQEWERAHAQKK
jgi:hypothetical protein